MSEWWTYSLTDFLLFSPATYYRLLEAHNRDMWPAQVIAVIAAIALSRRLRADDAPSGTFLLLAAGWAMSGILFHSLRYTTINWAATWFAGGFLLQALLLAFLAYRLRAPAQTAGVTRALGWLLLGCGLLVYPLLPGLTGRPIWQAEIFALTPDPTVIATLGLLVLHSGRARWLLLPIPLLWCAIGGATLIAMDSPTAFLLPLAGILALVAMARGHRPFGT